MDLSTHRNPQVFNSLTIPTTDFYLNFYEHEERYLQRANLYVVIMKAVNLKALFILRGLLFLYLLYQGMWHFCVATPSLAERN